MGFFRVVCLLFVLPLAVSAGSLVWPTPNPAFQEGAPLEAFIQPTVSGRTESGLFGCVRNDGSRFHEGLDLRALKRDRRGEALDEVYAVLPGRVAHVNRIAGHSSYGRYVVVVHDGETPAFHTLYAHLASVGEAIRPGARVESGTVLGVMGRSAAGYTISRARAHLHFEIGFRLTPDFQAWYDRQQYGSRNRHGSWNGMNLVSVNPLDFYGAMRRGEVDGFKAWLDRREVVARIRVHASAVPGFVRGYPALLERPLDDGRSPVAWDIGFTAYGVPLRWRARYADEGLGGREGDVRILAYDAKALADQSCRRVLSGEGSAVTLSRTTESTIEKLFGMR